MTEIQDPEVGALCLTLFMQSFITNKSCWRKLTIPDCAEPDIEYAYGWFTEDEDAVWMEVVKLNANDFWRGYFYFNDMEPPEDAVGLECNTREHLDYHWESNNGGGHYDCTHYEHVSLMVKL